MKKNKTFIKIMFWMIPIIFILLWLSQFGIFKNPNIRKAESLFYEKNGFSVEIDKIDTFTNEKFAKILIQDFGSLILTDSLLKIPNEIHHYSLKAKRKGSRKKYKKYNYNQYEFSSIMGGLTVDKDFNRIENPLYYRVKRLIEDDNKSEYQLGQENKTNQSTISNSLKEMDLSKYEYGKE